MSAAAGALVPAPARPRVFATLGAALGLLWNHPIQLLVPYGAVSALVVVESLVVIALTSGEPLPIAGRLALDLGEGVVLGVAGAAIVVAVAALAREQPASIPASFGPLARRPAALLALAALAVIVTWASTLPTWIVYWATSDASNSDRATANAVASVLWLPVTLYVGARFALAFQLFLLEGTGPAQSFIRSWRMMTGSILRMIGILLVIGLVQGVIAAAAAVLTSLLVVGRGDEQAFLSITTAVSGVSGFLLGALTIAAVTLHYLRLREAAP